MPTSSTAERTLRKRRKYRDGLLALVLVLLVFWMFMNAFSARSLLGDTNRETPAAIVTWVALSLVSAGIVIRGFIQAARHGRGWAVAGFLSIGVIVALSIVAFSVPRDILTPEPATNHLPSTYVPCYSGSDCPGG